MVVSEFGTCRSGRSGGCVGGEPRGMEGSGPFWGPTGAAGSVMIQSADPSQLPLVTPDFHSDPKDRQAMIDLVRYARKFVAQPAFEGLVFEETRPGPGYESDGEIIAAFDRMGPAPIMPPAVAAWAWTLIRWSISAFECGASKEREWSTPRCCRSSSPATPTARSRRSLSARRI